MLEIRDLTVEASGRIILDSVKLTVRDGEKVLLLGPNGSGKSSLMQTIMGNPSYKILSGSIMFNGRDITGLSPEERARIGIGLIFQIPPKVKGVRLMDLIERIAKMRGIDLDEIRRKAEELRISHLLERDLNVGFSGGEMKKAELLIMLSQRPKLALIDEIDSGVDVESMEHVGSSLNGILSSDTSAIVVTHTGYISKYINADIAYVMLNGRIVCSGDPNSILDNIRREGFEACMSCKRAI
ncbi:MAG: ABC transporter ATP-binding protein [Candidatus Methanodesulfokora sp.]|jgi:Fe-S cluster assembly ATP-binding protein|nr:MAG: ABC transporter ATP-binding protein [Candidatus Korarchaeota archaeon]